MTRSSFRTLLFGPVLLLAACAEIPVRIADDDPAAEALWQSREVILRGINGWAIKARLGIQTAEDGWSASLHWAQQEQLYKMRIFAPLGQGTYELKGGHGGVTLLTEKNELFEAASPDALMRENLGWSVPVLGLQHWILGIPDPGSRIDSRGIDTNGRLVRLQQQGWNIDLSRYVSVGEYDLPGRLVLQNPHIKVKIVIQDWVKVI
ncbi:MAG: lipoprotein insertase outer membrane protein LolB [Thiotrichales bacterium]|nr:lipoprotein insertase outer membrane protein LolB [Thiotrichales bacterium]